MKNPIYVFVLLSMSSFYFSATGLILWTINYLVKVLKAKTLDAQAINLFVNATSAVPGVLFGSAVLDAYGGYKN